MTSTCTRSLFCQFALQSEWSLREQCDMDGKAFRPSERARASQYHDEYLYS